MKRKIFAISVLMTAFFTAIPCTGFSQDEKSPAPATSQDEKAAAPDTGAASEDQKAAAPDAGSPQDRKAVTPDTGASQNEKASTSGTSSSPEGKVMVPTGPSTGEKAGAEGLSEYTIVRHDTLWGISKKFLKDPLKWPKIWKQNPYIKNPDLIYPGNIVRISPDGHVEIVKAPPPPPKELPTVVLEEQKENVVELQPPAAKEGEAKTEAAPGAKEAKEKAIKMGKMVKKEKSKTPVLASELMVRRGFIARHELDAAGVIVEPKELEDRLYFTQGDKVIVSFKDKEYKKGDRFAIIREGMKIYHPVTGSYMGKLVESLGTLTITDADTPSEAVIDQSYKEITRGAGLVPFKETPAEMEITGTESEISGYVIASASERDEFSEGNIVYIDKGGKDGLKNGNVMRIYRERKRVSDPVKGGYINLPPFDLGKLVVIDAGEKTSSAIIVRSTQAIHAGDEVATAPASKEASSK